MIPDDGSALMMMKKKKRGKMFKSRIHCSFHVLAFAHALSTHTHTYSYSYIVHIADEENSTNLKFAFIIHYSLLSFVCVCVDCKWQAMRLIQIFWPKWPKLSTHNNKYNAQHQTTRKSSNLRQKEDKQFRFCFFSSSLFLFLLFQKVKCENKKQ